MHGWQPRIATAIPGSPLIAAATFAVLAIVSFLFFREPPILSDQLDYFSAAWTLPDVTPTHRHLRIGLVWPVWALTRFFGYSEFAYYGVPLLTRFLLGFSTWLLARHMFSPRVAWVAGVLIMMTPGYTRVASQLLPDYFAASLLTLGMALIFLASKASWPRRTGVLTLLASGACIGWAYLAREYVVILFPCFALAMLLLRIPLRGWVLFCLGALAMYSLELLWGWLNYGDPLIRLSASAAPRETDREFATNIPEILMLLPQRFSTYGGWALSGFSLLGLAAPLAMVRKGGPAWRVLLAWSVVGWLIFTTIALLPVLLFEGKAVYLRLHMFRYWSIIFPPIFIGATAALFTVIGYVQNQHGRRFAFAATVLLFSAPVVGTAAGLHEVAGAGSLVRNDGAAYQEFRSFVQNHSSPPQVLWMDRASGVASSNSLPIYLNSPSGRTRIWTGEVRYLNSSRRNWLDESEIRSGLVALDRTRASFGFRLGMPRHFVNPESVWQAVFRSSNGMILVLAPESSPLGAPTSLREHPASLQVIRTGDADGTYSSSLTSYNTLRLRIDGQTRVVVADGAARRLGAPDNVQSRIPEAAKAVVGRILLADPSLGGRASARCLFYDGEGQRRTVWSDLAGPLDDFGAAEYAYEFSCRIPAGPPTVVSARMLVQFSRGTDVEILGLEYGFVTKNQ